MYRVYVLVNRTAARRYIGQTSDLQRRLAEHNGQSTNLRRFTRKYAGKWELIHTQQFSTRAEAMRQEKWLKSGAGRKWLDEQFGRASPPEAD